VWHLNDLNIKLQGEKHTRPTLDLIIFIIFSNMSFKQNQSFSKSFLRK